MDEHEQESVVTFYLEGLGKFVDLDNELKFLGIAVSPDNTKFALATDKHLIVTDDRDIPNYSGEKIPPPIIQTLLEFSEETGKCTVLKWLTNDVICVGFHSGDFACFDADGKGIMEQRCDSSPVQALQMSETLLPGTGIPSYASSLWILHASGVLAVVPAERVLLGVVEELIRFKLLSTKNCTDFVLLPAG